MSKANIKVNIKANQDIEKEKYSFLKIKAHLQQKELDKILQNIVQKIGANEMPFFMIELPDSVEEEQIPIFKSVFTHQKVKQNGRVYHFGDFKNKESSLFLKKIEKVYHLLVNLDNEAQLKIGFYDIAELPKRINVQDIENQYKQVCALLEGLTIEGNIRLDEKGMESFKELTKKISPQFIDSPIVAVLELFQLCEAQIELDPFDVLQDSLLKQLFATLKYKNEPDDRILSALRKSEGNMKIYITSPRLFSIEVECECQTLGTVLSFL